LDKERAKTVTGKLIGASKRGGGTHDKRDYQPRRG
jgi:hypothetical protein